MRANQRRYGFPYRGAIDDGVSPKRPGTLLDAFQPKMAVPYVLHIEPDSPILNLKLDAVVFSSQLDPHPVALAVAAGIGNALLNNAENGVLQHGLQPTNPRTAKLNLRLPLLVGLLNQVLDGYCQPSLVEKQRLQPADEPPRFRMAFTEHLHAQR